jgi:hypothetical protein
MRRFLLAAAFSLVACSSSSDGTDPTGSTEPTQPQDLMLSVVQPAVLLPATRMSVRGSDFVPETVGPARLVLRGDFNGSKVEVVLPAEFESSDELTASWRGALESGLQDKEGTFQGEAVVAIDEDDGKTHVSAPLQLTLEIKASLAPEVQDVAQGVIFVNDAIQVKGESFLLGGEEGETVAVLEGCFQPEDETTCEPIVTAQIGALPVSAYDRTRIAFPFAPNIAGIHPGSFDGTVLIRNRHGLAADSVVFETTSLPVHFDLTSTTIYELSPKVASLGQYVNVTGGGFVGVSNGSVDPGMAVTTLALTGSFFPTGTPDELPVDVTLVPEFVSGNLVRYVLSEQDDLGKSLDLRKASGEFSGSIRPTIQFQSDTVEGAPHTTSFQIDHVRQVVWVNFLAAYVGSLRHFGLRSADPLIRERIFDIAARDYTGINIEFRTEPPEDFALFAQVDIGGPDPNGYGLLGYDNTPGKDVDNIRLYDKIGGVNAATQEDGYPGYGGVFVESFFGFSEHPGTLAKKLEGADPFFDAIFDPFRPDRGGKPVEASDLNDLDIPTLTSGDACPVEGNDRGMQIACSVWVLGSMIGSTMTHEVGHSLGLADPYGGEFHNLGDGYNRLMDSGRFRPFLERAEILGYGPSVFCEEDFAYLQQVLPRDDTGPAIERPSCW